LEELASPEPTLNCKKSQMRNPRPSLEEKVNKGDDVYMNSNDGGSGDFVQLVS
jgi:hypothetical protein